jgi:predicted ATPase
MSFVQRLAISNYKSISAADIEVRRVNVLIGEPNTGKSNVLEALALLSTGVAPHIRQITRSREAADLFFDHDIGSAIDVAINGDCGWSLAFNAQKGNFDYNVVDPVKKHISKGSIPPNLGAPGHQWPQNQQSNFRYYHFASTVQRQHGSPPQYGYLQPPYGENLPALLYSNKGFRESISALFRSKGFRLEVRPQESEILMSKEINDILYSYPFEAISQTLQRIVFYKAVLETNRDAVLILDEPESNTFPFYTKYLAERISLDTHNQFFLTSHNPYVLTSLIEKTPVEELAVFMTRMRNYRTEFLLASNDQLREMLNLTMDIFLDLDRFFPN